MATPSPDLGALYLQHRDAMFRTAASILRSAGLADQAEDAVQNAVQSIMASPPDEEIKNWEAFLITAVRRKALDLLKSAPVQHAAGAAVDAQEHATDEDVAGDVAEAVDRSRRAGLVWDALSVLDQRHRKAVWDRVALERPRDEVAAELGVTPARVSQMVAAALSKLENKIDREEGA